MIPWVPGKAALLVLLVFAFCGSLGVLTVPVSAHADTDVATPAAVATVAPLFTTVIPVAALPEAPLQDFLLWQASIAPGVTVDVLAEDGTCCPGPVLTHVVTGALTLRVEGPLQISRASTPATPGSLEHGVAGSDVVLRPGDTALWRFEQPARLANLGPNPLRLVSGGLFGGSVPGPLAGYELLNFGELVPAPPRPPGPVTMELVRVSLPPGTALVAAPVGALRLAIRESGAGILARRADGTLANIGQRPVVVVVLTLFPRAGAGTLMP
jgi:hypothetical protein